MTEPLRDPDVLTSRIIRQYQDALDTAKLRWEYLTKHGEFVPPELAAIARHGRPVDAVTVLPVELINELTGHHIATRYTRTTGEDFDPVDWLLETIDEASEPAVTITVTETAIISTLPTTQGS